MTQMIFINLPVTDVARSTAFYEALGWAKEPTFSNEQATMIVVSDAIRVMLLSHDFFADFTPRRIPDAHETAQVMLCVSRESREAVDALVAAAGAAGGTANPNPRQDMGDTMYGGSFADPDGHIWEAMWTDPAAAEEGAAAFENT